VNLYGTEINKCFIQINKPSSADIADLQLFLRTEFKLPLHEK